MPIVGEVLAGRYRIDAPLGAGGMASVYRARDLRLDRDVALKVLLPNLARDPVLARRFDREARALAATSNPNVVAIYDVEPGDPKTGREPFYVMELCDAGSLADRLSAGGQIPPVELVPIIAAVADGLADLHGRGLVHRDVKPHNILFAGGRARLADFGLARSDTSSELSELSALTAAGTTVGTLAYLAPELLAGAPASRASDTYALAVVAFQGLTGRLPRPAQSVADVVESRGLPVPAVSETAPQLGTAFDDPIATALAIDPDRRPSPSELAASLNAALATTADRLEPTDEPRAPTDAAAEPAEAGSAPPVGPAAAALVAAAAAASRPDTQAENIDGEADTLTEIPIVAARERTGDGQGAGQATPGRTARRTGRRAGRPDRQTSPSALAVVAGIAAGLVLLAAWTAGLGGPGSRGTGSPSVPLASASPSASALSPAATADAVAAALDRLQDVRSAIEAARGGHDGLKGDDANELERLADRVEEALRKADFDAAREAADQLAERVDKLGDKVSDAAATRLRQAVDALVESIPGD